MAQRPPLKLSIDALIYHKIKGFFKIKMGGRGHGGPSRKKTEGRGDRLLPQMGGSSPGVDYLVPRAVFFDHGSWGELL